MTTHPFVESLLRAAAALEPVRPLWRTRLWPFPVLAGRAGAGAR